MFEFRNISLSRKDKIILNECSIKFSAGERTVITGDSGTGKTTILNLLTGLAKADSGEILFMDRLLDAGNISELRARTAYIGQEPTLGAETVEGALMLPFTFRANRKTDPPDEEVERILDFLLLDRDIRSKKAASVSGGEKQRIAVARAILTGRTIFLADEITSALDPTSTQRIFELFSDGRYSLISVSHDPEWIKFCDRRLLLEHGRLKEV